MIQPQFSFLDLFGRTRPFEGFFVNFNARRAPKTTAVSQTSSIMYKRPPWIRSLSHSALAGPHLASEKRQEAPNKEYQDPVRLRWSDQDSEREHRRLLELQGLAHHPDLQPNRRVDRYEGQHQPPSNPGIKRKKFQTFIHRSLAPFPPPAFCPL